MKKYFYIILAILLLFACKADGQDVSRLGKVPGNGSRGYYKANASDTVSKAVADLPASPSGFSTLM